VSSKRWIRIGVSVERLYCKRPILCLASSKILTPHPPHRPASVYPPPLVRGEDTLAGWRGGRGVNILEDARHSSVIYICKYFVGIRQKMLDPDQDQRNTDTKHWVEGGLKVGGNEKVGGWGMC
jgi:hypothetical protein